MNRFQEVLEQFDTAINKNPENADLYNNKALVLMQMKRSDEALEYFDLAINISPSKFLYQINKANALTQIKSFEAALEYFDSANLMCTEDSPSSKDKATKEEYFVQATQKNPEDQHQSTNLSCTFLNFLSLAETLTCEQINNEAGILFNQNNLSNLDIYYLNKALALAQINNFDESLEIFDLAIQNNPENSKLYNAKAMTLIVFK